MKTFTLPLFSAVLLPLLAAGSVVDNFNRIDSASQGGSSGLPPWWTWHLAGEPAPSIRFTRDAAEGNAAMELTMPKAKGTLFAGRLCSIPSSCNALSLWVKREKGTPNCFAVFESDPRRTPAGIKRFGTRLPVPEGARWSRIILPLSAFRNLNRNSPEDTFDPAEIGTISFHSFHNPAPFTLKVDLLEFITTGSAPETAALPDAGTNLLPGDTDFETGTGSWIVLRSDDDGVPLRITDRDGATGSSSLSIAPTVGPFCSDCSNILRKGVPYTLSFSVKSARPDQLSCLVVNSRWNTLAFRLFPTTPQWQRVQLAIPPQPADAVCNIIFAQHPRKSEIRLDAIQLETGEQATPFRRKAAAAVNAVTGEPGEIVPADPEKPLKLELRVANFSIPADRQPLSLRGEIRHSAGTEPIRFFEQFRLAPGETLRRELLLSAAARPGYYPLELTLRDAKGTLITTEETPFAVVGPVSATAVADSFFGIHPGYMPVTALRRIGAKWIRFGIEWQHAEPRPGKFNSGVITNRRNYAALGMAELCTLANPPAWAKKNGAQPENPAVTAEFLARVLRGTRDTVACYELDNEPDLKQNTSPAAYAAWLQAVHPLLRDAGKKLLFGESGGGSEFAEQIFRRASGSFDIYGPHPYTSPRYLGPVAGSAIGPEEGDLDGRLKTALDRIRRHGNRQELWIGELGWGIDRETRFDSIYARKHAEFLARACLIARNQPAVKRLIWFTALGVLEAKRYEYGLWTNRNGIRPRPAAAAYATLARLLDGATPRKPVCDSEIKVFVYQRPDGRNLFALWDTSDDTTDPVSFPVRPGEAEIHSMTGFRFDTGATDQPVTVKITGSPLYLLPAGLSASALSLRIEQAIAGRRPLRIATATPDSRTLRLTLHNNLTGPLSGTIEPDLAGESLRPQPFAMEAGGSATLEFPLASPLAPDGTPVRFFVRSTTGQTAEIRRRLPGFTAVPRFRGGNFLDNGLKGNPMFLLNRRDQVLPADPAVGWNSPKDLSASASIAWDDRFFYFECTVTDPVFCQPFSGREIWKGDAIQLAFDSDCDAIPGGYDQNDSEFGFALTPGGPLAWRWHARAGKSAGAPVSLPLRILRKNGKVIYRAAIPWEELSDSAPRPGRLFGFNFIAGSNNGFGRNYWIGIAPGIVEGKKPELFPKFMLER